MLATRFTAFCLVAIAAAAPAVPKATGAAREVPPDMVVIHAVSGPVCDLGLNRVIYNVPDDSAVYWKDYLERQEVTGIHYVIGRDGSVLASIPEREIANHASKANARSIGIELVNRGDSLEPYPEAQVVATIRLVKDIRTRYTIPLANVLGHEDVDQRTCPCGDDSVFRRRQDPGSEFPMNRLRSEVAAPGETVGVSDFSPMTGAAPPNACPVQP